MTPSKNDPSASEILILPDGPIPSCPILLEAQTVLNKAHNLRKALHHLARSTRRCLTCPENGSCPSIRYFDHAVDQALIQLTRERGLDRE
jgi:hypothetical protein